METDLPEALLEMHYHRALVDLFANHFGRGFLKILKPSARAEALLGFDQGWIRGELPLATLRSDLERAIKLGGTAIQSLYVGYFLQFKRVERCARRPRKKALRAVITSTPYYRSKLDLRPNARTGKSQHENLLRLQQIAGCDVNYACPMLFDQDDLHEEPDLDGLRIVPLTTAPTGYASNEQHHICFKDRQGQAYWCSDPVEAVSRSAKEWPESRTGYRLLTAKDLLEFLTNLAQNQAEIDEGRRGPLLPRSLTVVELGPEAEVIEQGRIGDNRDPQGHLR